MNLKELKGRKKVADGKESDEVSLEYIAQEGSYGAIFKKVKGGYQATKIDYYNLADTPFDSAPDYFTPDEGETITEKQFEEIKTFIEEVRNTEIQEWWDDLDDEDKRSTLKNLLEEGSNIDSLTKEQIEDLFYAVVIWPQYREVMSAKSGTRYFTVR